MIRVTIIDQFGEHILPRQLSAADLNEVAAQAKSLVRDCERIVELNNPAPGRRQVSVPYSS